MKKTTQGDLSKKLLKYGALSAAVMGLADANGQIEYTDVDPDVVLSSGELFAIDINGDSIDDYEIENTTGANTVIRPTAGNGFVGFAPSYAYPSNLAADVMVDENSPIVIDRGGTFYFNNCSFASDWCGGVVDGYAGLVFQIAGQTHYGWARLDIEAGRTTMTLKDFAYNATPGEAILTGQTLGVNEFSPIDFSYLVDSNNVLTMTSNEALENLKVYNVVGKEVMASSLSARNEQVDVSALSTGVYLAKVSIGSQSKTFKFVKR